MDIYCNQTLMKMEDNARMLERNYNECVDWVYKKKEHGPYYPFLINRFCSEPLDLRYVDEIGEDETGTIEGYQEHNEIARENNRLLSFIKKKCENSGYPEGYTGNVNPKEDMRLITEMRNYLHDIRPRYMDLLDG